jgi:DNA-directed RNA polymerase specialized sigma24 family protein
MGGVGGGHRFHVEGSEECTKIKSELYAKKLSLNRLETELLKRGRKVEEFIAGISEARKKRIFILRYIDGLQWRDVAAAVHRGQSTVFADHKRACEIFDGLL